MILNISLQYKIKYFLALQQLSSTTSPTWLDSVLGQSKQGVFSADFEGKNNTVLEVGDGDSVVLDCEVFLKQEKTVRIARY